MPSGRAGRFGPSFLFFGAVACAVVAIVEADDAMASEKVSCNIEVQQLDTAILASRFVALAKAEVPVAGRFTFTVFKIGSAGRNQSVQMGNVELAAGETREVSSVSLSIEEGSSYEVELVIETDDGATARCQRMEDGTAVDL